MKNTSYGNLILEIKNILKDILASVPSLRVKEKNQSESQGIARPDFVFLVNNGVSSKWIVVEIKSSGEPRYVRSAIQQIKEYISQFDDAYGIVGAPFISNDTAMICKQSGVGYIDTAGNCLINFGQIYIERKNYPNPKTEKRTLRSIFSRKATRIIRVLLCNPKRFWKVQELAQESNVSLGLAFKVKERLLDLDYAKVENRKIGLSRPQELLSKWANNYSFRKNTLYDCFSIKSAREVEQSLAEYCLQKRIPYAFTLFSGAALVAPFSRYTRGFVYIKDNLENITNALELKRVDSGANFTLMQPYDDGVFYGKREIKNSAVVSDIQLYLDLVSYKGRGEESAQFLLEQRLKPQW